MEVNTTSLRLLQDTHPPLAFIQGYDRVVLTPTQLPPFRVQLVDKVVILQRKDFKAAPSGGRWPRTLSGSWEASEYYERSWHFVEKIRFFCCRHRVLLIVWCMMKGGVLVITLRDVTVGDFRGLRRTDVKDPQSPVGPAEPVWFPLRAIRITLFLCKSTILVFESRYVAEKDNWVAQSVSKSTMLSCRVDTLVWLGSTLILF